MSILKKKASSKIAFSKCLAQSKQWVNVNYCYVIGFLGEMGSLNEEGSTMSGTDTKS